MARKREQSPLRKMKPVFLVFCEGKTEEAYLNFLKRNYRTPIKIIPTIKGGNISQRVINKESKQIGIEDNEQVTAFLMYDLDVEDVNKKLRECDATWLCTNPCIELWFLLHCKEQTKVTTTKNCIAELKSNSIWTQYEKSYFTDTQQNFLWSHKADAIQRAKNLKENQNPSSSIYKLLEAIEK